LLFVTSTASLLAGCIGCGGDAAGESGGAPVALWTPSGHALEARRRLLRRPRGAGAPHEQHRERERAGSGRLARTASAAERAGGRTRSYSSRVSGRSTHGAQELDGVDRVVVDPLQHRDEALLVDDLLLRAGDRERRVRGLLVLTVRVSAGRLRRVARGSLASVWPRAASRPVATA
jgi:hypothetical protein